jgi:hypothetical protein
MSPRRAKKKQQKSEDSDTEVLPIIRSEDRWDCIEECLGEIRRSQMLADHNRSVMRKKKAESERHFRERLKKARYGR